MGMDRRTLLRGGVALLIAAPLGGLAARPAQRLLSCRSNAAGEFFATLFDSDGQILRDLRLPARGHGFALDPAHRTAVVFARRPGSFMTAIDIVGNAPPIEIEAPRGRHFYGHGVFAPQDGLLYVTENAYEEGVGRLGVYDSRAGYRRIGEIDTQGVGPHEVRLLADGRTLVVANGGIRTHPDMPRAKLNLDSMRSTLVYLDRHSGALLASHPTPEPWQRLSIRHIDVSAADRVAIVMQYEGPKTDRPPLIAVQAGQASPTWLSAPDAIQTRMRNYCGSVTFRGDGRAFAVSSPRGGLVTHWSDAGRYLGSFDQADVCGVAAHDATMWFSDGSGGLSEHADAAVTRRHFGDARWDNHMLAV